MKKAFGFLILSLVISLILVSCETTSYYGQAVAGQYYILRHREDIEALISDESTSPELRNKLETILSIRIFAEQELMLPLGENYSTYVDLNRPYVVWNVFASPEFSMDPVKWCYPVAGCVSYRGYFAEEDAQEFAKNLAEKENDVYVGGVAAYSTLGWFSDSVLSTIINRDDYQLASLIFHELAHQLLYIPGDTEFNESFATAVEKEGLKRWLEFIRNERNLSAADIERIIESAELNRQRQEEFVALVSATVESLRQLYTSEEQEPNLRESKRVLYANLKLEYESLKDSWEGYDGYDAWFGRDLNNAQLNTVATYFNWVPAFNALLTEEKNDLENFYSRVISMKDLDIKARKELLESALEF